MYQKRVVQPIPVEERLKKREEYYTKDDSIPLMIKSGDIEGLKWLFQKVQDNDGMCYLASDLAVHHGQMEIARLFTDLERQGPPRQKISLKFGNLEKEFIMANSDEDWRMFKAEIKQALNIPGSFKVVNRLDQEKKKLRWRDLREGRRYNVELK